MLTTLVATKLYLPPSRTNAVLRPQLTERLHAGLHRKLTLIAAPAGFGKTTLVSTWLAVCERPVAWLSLDEGEGDLPRFLSYLIAAVQTIEPTMGDEVLGMLQASPPLPSDTILTALVNALAAIPEAFVLVLDDYHRLDAPLVDDALAFVLEHQPPSLHLVITTREDPQLPLARLRARDQITELRAADLRLSATEAAKFLTEVMGLHLSVADIATLERRTEGWIAGLQLAALSMRGRTDLGQFVQAFAGDNRAIVDYLIDEVLQHQPEPVRNFLLQTSMLDRLHGPLCDAVTGQADGSAQLAALERGNFFVVPLDDQRRWYRYHQLFADVLGAQLRTEQPELVATLHQRASAWYAATGLSAEAIRHALAASDYARAAELIELAAPAMSKSRQTTMLLGWLRALPSEVIRARPVLSVTTAHLLLDGGELDGVEAQLRDAEWWLDSTADDPAPRAAPAAAMIVVDDATFRRLPGAIAIARAGLALAQGDLDNTVSYAQQVLDLVPEDDHLSRGGAAGFLGLAAWMRGDLAVAHQTFAAGMAQLHKAGNIADTLNGAMTLADIRITQGRLHEAMQTYEQASQLALAQQPAGSRLVVRGTADIAIGMSEICREQNDLPAAIQHLLHSETLGEHTGFPQHRYRWCVAMARIREAQGDLDGALELLQEAERRSVRTLFPNLRPVAALRTRVWVAQGRLGEAFAWVRAQGLALDDALSSLREFEHITFARVLLAHAISKQGDCANRTLCDVATLLQRLLDAADAGERMGCVIEILVLQARTQQAQGNIPAALLPLARAMTLAAPEGYVRVFVDEGVAMAALLQEALRCGIMPSFVEQLLTAFPDEHTRKAGHDHAVALSASHPVTGSLIEPLSLRERDVLRLLRTDLSGPDIARELMVSLHTLRTHTKNIFSKLGSSNRRAAVRRAEELGLF